MTAKSLWCILPCKSTNNETWRPTLLQKNHVLNKNYTHLHASPSPLMHYTLHTRWSPHASYYLPCLPISTDCLPNHTGKLPIRRGLEVVQNYYCPLNTLLLPYLRIWPFDKPPLFGLLHRLSAKNGCCLWRRSYEFCRQRPYFILFLSFWPINSISVCPAHRLSDKSDISKQDRFFSGHH